MPIVTEKLQDLKPCTSKPCSRYGRLLQFEFRQILTHVAGILYCESCRYSRKLFEVISEENIEEINGQYFINTDKFRKELKQ